jgi:hypothetical protein
MLATGILTMTRKVTPMPVSAPISTGLLMPTLTTTFAADPATYEGLRNQHLTVRVDYDYNPWHRKPRGPIARARKLRDGLWWSFRKRVLRRKLTETASITVPNCQMIAPDAPSGGLIAGV